MSTKADTGKIAAYGDFWPYYLQEHSKPETRAIHYVGTSLAIAALIAAVVTQIWWLLLLVPVAGYLFAWIGHFGIEKNRPATFTYPLWSLYSDFRMYVLWLSGGLGAHLRAHNIRPNGR